MRVFARRKWGQNFLVDPNLLRRIVRTLELKSTDRVLEIGPGEGALTEHILPEVAALAAVEIDPRLIEHLRREAGLQACRFIHGDVLLLELSAVPLEPPLRIVGNIPYNITSPILFWLVEQQAYWEDAFLMVQKELAERLTAGVGTKAYGRLTVMIRAFMEVRTCFTIPPEVFVPRPQVESAFIALKKRPRPLVPPQLQSGFEKLVAAAFSKRRKMLRNSLAGFVLSPEGVRQIDLTRRPETLTVEEFVQLLPEKPGSGDE